MLLQTTHLFVGLLALLPNAFAFKDPLDRKTPYNGNLMKLADYPTLNYTVDAPYDFQIVNPGAAVMTGDSITIYYIFYGNFSDLEIDRITNYAKHISDKDTKPDRWSVAKRYYDSNGNYVTKPMKYGGYVHDTSYSYGFNISTTQGSDDIVGSDVAKIITSYIGNGKKFPYDPMAIYTLVSPPEVKVQDCPDPLDCYGGYHFSFNATIDNETKLINHAYSPAFLADIAVGTVDIAPNGDTGRKVVDFVVTVLHHEFMEAMSDPQAYDDNTRAWNDVLSYAENGDVCMYNLSYPALRFTENTLNATGRYYNTIINGVKYALQDIWGFDENGIQSCYAESRATRYHEFKSVKAAVNVVTAVDGIKGYNGPINVPCEAYYGDRRFGGYYTLGGPDVCNIVYNGEARRLQDPDTGLYYKIENATFAFPTNYHVLSHNHAHYEWRRDVDESVAIMTFDDDVNVPVATRDGKVFVVYESNFQWTFEEDQTTVVNFVDKGAYYYCRALVEGVWYAGETNKFKDDCVVNADGKFVLVSKKDPSVSFLMKPAPGR
ncbi:hypothetical protein HDU76_001211 [Blyttiomyces sp. JEL0837]|nr:hypothetical protein HDU76_001211 [Blyttiomyces sp. JEL0837]